MAIYFMDGFDQYDTNQVGMKGWTANDRTVVDTGRKKTGRASLRFDSGNYDANTGCALRAFPNSTTVCVGFTCYNPASKNMSFRFLDGATLNVSVRINANGTITILRGSTVLGTSPNVALMLNTWMHFQFKVTIDPVNGSVEVRLDGEEFFTLTGINTQVGSNSQVNVFSINAAAGYFWVDDFYIADDFQGVCLVETLNPIANGATNQFTPSAGANFECVDETFPNSTDFISTKIVGSVDTFVTSDLASIAGDVKGVQVDITAKKDDLGYKKVSPVVRPGVVDAVGTPINLSGAYLIYREVFNINPETSLPWTIAEVNATEFGVKITE